MDKAALGRLVDSCPFHRFLAMTVEEVDAEAGLVTMSLPLRQEFSRSDEELELHGGITAAFIDIVGDYAIAALIGRGVPTINLRVDYLRMGRGSRITATARVVKAGRTIGTVDIVVRDDAGREIAIGRGTYATGG
ncbi:MAG: PaaI family thioesterase [Azospirillaceae bacterium]